MHKLNKEELRQQESLRCDAYKLFSECYSLPVGDMQEKIVKLQSVLLQPVSGSNIEDVGILKVDYAGLFVGPFKLLAPPYGSLYLEEKQQLMTDSTLDAKKCYMEEGLETAIMEVPDHITIELEFMHFLVYNEIKAIDENDAERVRAYIEKQKDFMESHLAAWTPEFCKNIDKNAKTLFYKELSALTRKFIDDDSGKLSDSSILNLIEEELCLE